MRNHLACRSTRGRETKVINDVVQTRLQNLQHLLAGDTTALERLFVNAPELLLHQTVVITKLLLLDEAKAVVRHLAAGLRAVDTGTVVAAFEILRGAEHRDTEAAADANAGTCIASHKNLRFSIYD